MPRSITPPRSISSHRSAETVPLKPSPEAVPQPRTPRGITPPLVSAHLVPEVGAPRPWLHGRGLCRPAPPPVEPSLAWAGGSVLEGLAGHVGAGLPGRLREALSSAAKPRTAERLRRLGDHADCQYNAVGVHLWWRAWARVCHPTLTHACCCSASIRLYDDRGPPRQRGITDTMVSITVLVDSTHPRQHTFARYPWELLHLARRHPPRDRRSCRGSKPPP